MTALTTTNSLATEGLFGVEAQRAARVMMRKSPATQRTYQGIYERFAGWLAHRDGGVQAPVGAFTSETLIGYLEELEERCSAATVSLSALAAKA